MKIKRTLFAFTALALGSCASYSASPLCYPSTDLIQTSSQDGGISIVSKAFSMDDCYTYLDRDVVSEGYQPVQIYIQNNSSKNYLFSLSRLGLAVANPKEVAQRVHTSTAGRAAAYGVGALFLWPLVIPAIVDGIKSSDANTALDYDFASKSAKDQLIFSHSRFNAILFVPVDTYQNCFTLTLLDEATKEPKTFQVKINS